MLLMTPDQMGIGFTYSILHPAAKDKVIDRACLSSSQVQSGKNGEVYAFVVMEAEARVRRGPCANPEAA